MILLQDADGGREFIENLVDAARKLALLYAATPDDTAREHLESYLGSIESGVIEAVGAGTGAEILEAFRDAVMCEKHRLEKSGTSRA